MALVSHVSSWVQKKPSISVTSLTHLTKLDIFYLIYIWIPVVSSSGTGSKCKRWRCSVWWSRWWCHCSEFAAKSQETLVISSLAGQRDSTIDVTSQLFMIKAFLPIKNHSGRSGATQMLTTEAASHQNRDWAEPSMFFHLVFSPLQI